MNQSKFGAGLIILGVIITIISLISYKKNDPSAESIAFSQSMNRLSTVLGVASKRDIASEYADKRKTSSTFIVFGLIMTGVGIVTMISTSGVKKCPFCAEGVNIDAIRCRHCGADISK